jgi:hypothetical protein
MLVIACPTPTARIRDLTKLDIYASIRCLPQSAANLTRSLETGSHRRSDQGQTDQGAKTKEQQFRTRFLKHKGTL